MPQPVAETLELGRSYQRAGALAPAEELYRQVVQAEPSQAEAWFLLGQVCQAQGRTDEALMHHREAVRLAPTSAAAHIDLGTALCLHDDTAEALTHCREAVRLQPDFVPAHLGLSLVLANLGRLSEALACCDRALELAPDHPQAHRDRALGWLLQGDFARGWPEYEWRLRTLPPRTFSQPRWDGSPLAGKTILLYAEQGLGDTLQFVRYASLVKARGATVVLQVQPPLLRLLSGVAGVDVLVAEKDTLPAFDVHAPLLSLPLLFGTDLATIPAEVPYLRADPALVAHWRSQLASRPGFKIGIAWQGSDKNTRNRQRSIALAAFEALARVEGVRLVSLQKGAGSEQVRALAGRFPVAELADCDEARGPFMDTAALVQALDLVVCCDTALGHLAGALGVPCWLALPFAPDWRWLIDREDSPWYPRHRLFRQDRPGAWDGVFQRMVAALREQVPTTPVEAGGRPERAF